MVKEIIMVALAAFAGQHAHSATFLDAKAERAAAEEAEKNGDWEAALLHYENIYDSTKADEATRAELRAKFKALLPKVPPNTDESKAGRWTVRGYVFRTLDITWKDDDGNDHHAKHSFSDEDIDNIRTAFKDFAGHVWEHSWGNLKIEWEIVVIEEPLTEFDTVAGPGETMHLFKDLEMAQFDSLFVFARPRSWTDEPLDDTENIKTNYLAGILPITPDSKGALYIGFNMHDSWGIMIHEYLHAVGCTLDAYQGYPQGIMGNPDNDSDCFGMLRYHATRKMLRELSATKRVDNPWVNQFCRDFLIAGPFATEGEAERGTDVAYIDEAAPNPVLDGKAGDRTWQSHAILGNILDFLYAPGYEPGEHQLAYAAAVVYADKEQIAQLRFGSDGACKVWQDGKLIVQMPEGGGGPDANIIGVRLKEGANQFIVKSTSTASHWWRVYFRICDTRGNPIEGVTYGLPGE